MDNSISEIVAKVLAHSKPILLPDTCSILDIIRTPSRNEMQNNIIYASQKILTNIKQNKTKYG